MKRKISFFAALISLLLLSCFAFVNFGVFANGKDVKPSDGGVEFSGDIVAVTPKNGESVSLANVYLKTLFDRFDGNYSSVSSLLNITDEMGTFADVLRDADVVRALYNKYDDFKPVNNALKWEYCRDAENYTVILSRDSDLSTYLYKTETADTELSLDNILYPDETYFWQVKANTSDGEVVSEIFTFNTEDTIRTIDIDGVSNTRDIGGFDSLYGKTLNGLVYRSARLDDITEKGIAQLDALGVKSDVDLRALNEGKRNPSGRENDYAYLDAPMYLSVFDDSKKEDFKNIVKIFADPENYPIIFHCSIGRDRTGSLSFILNNLLGVSQNEILCEYLTSFFSVSGALSVSKVNDDMLQALNGMYLLLDGYDGASYAEKTANYLLSIGVSAEEINAIRDIMTGKIKVLADADADNNAYQGKCFVSFSCFGKTQRIFAVSEGTVVFAPYELEKGYFWAVNGKVADLSEPIAGNTDFVAVKAETFAVNVVVDGKKSEQVFVKGDKIDLAQFEKAGYNCVFINQSGDIITSAVLTVDKDFTLNVIHIKQ